MNSNNIHNAENHPIDVVVAWVDGSDSRLSEKRNRYLIDESGGAHPGSHPTRFASVNEIRYCILSILRFAAFVRNIFIVTDGQDPDLYDDIKRYFPERMNSVRIVDHKEIFGDFEQYLPTFNSISIATMIWRIRGLSENFVYINDDTFLIREIRPEDWFVSNMPVLRGSWIQLPLLRILWYAIRRTVYRYFVNKTGFNPRASFHMGQWNAASLLGFKYRYFLNHHTPHPVGKNKVEEFFSRNRNILEKNISYRFRNYKQFTFISLSNHLQLLDGNRYIGKPDLAYLKPYGHSSGYIEGKIRFCERNPQIKFMCVQSLEMCSREDQRKVFGWLERIMML